MKSNSGITIHLILALFLGIVILGASVFLNSAKNAVKPPFLLKIKAEYQMESAIAMIFQRLRAIGPNHSTATLSLDITRREIAPGVILSASVNRLSSDSFQIESSVDGGGLKKHLNAKASVAVNNDNSASSTEISFPFQWHMEYLPEANSK